MSVIVATELDPEIGNTDQLLATRGRSSTPPPPNKAKIKLADMLRISYHSENPHHSKLKVATIVHDELYDELEKTYSLLPLLPSCLINSVDDGQPQMIVIHRSAFLDGPWFGTEDAAAGETYELVRRLLPWSRKRNVPVIFIENGQPDRYFTSGIREIGSEIIPSPEAVSRVPEGAPRSAIFQTALRYARTPLHQTTEFGN